MARYRVEFLDRDLKVLEPSPRIRCSDLTDGDIQAGKLPVPASAIYRQLIDAETGKRVSLIAVR
jgi:hypothetical protein